MSWLWYFPLLLLKSFSTHNHKVSFLSLSCWIFIVNKVVLLNSSLSLLTGSIVLTWMSRSIVSCYAPSIVYVIRFCSLMMYVDTRFFCRLLSTPFSICALGADSSMLFLNGGCSCLFFETKCLSHGVLLIWLLLDGVDDLGGWNLIHINGIRFLIP